MIHGVLYASAAVLTFRGPVRWLNSRRPRRTASWDYNQYTKKENYHEPSVSITISTKIALLSDGSFVGYVVGALLGRLVGAVNKIIKKK